MSNCEINWYNPEQNIICTEYGGAWTWDDFHQILDKAITMMHSVNGRVDLIVAPKPNSIMPRGSAEPHLKRAIQLMPSNFGIQVIVTKSVLSRTMASIFTKLFSKSAYSNRLFFVTSLAEADQLIRKDRIRTNTKQAV
jgi:hypothetical protein